MATNVILIQRYHSPCGDLLLGSYKDQLCLCDWVGRSRRERIDRRLYRFLQADYVEGVSPVIQEAVRQLDAYFRQKCTVFDVPLLLAGTEFQQQVWCRLQEIPYGETVSYAELAGRLGMPKAVRAVANANGANAISIFVPCHRVVGSNRSLTGYAGGIEAKKFLITLEASFL